MTMPDKTSERARLLANRAVHQNRLNGLDQAARRRAEKLTRAAPDLPSSFGRHASDWSRRHEARCQAELSKIAGDQRADRATLKRKIARQTEALRRLVLKEARSTRDRSTQQAAQ